MSKHWIKLFNHLLKILWNLEKQRQAAKPILLVICGFAMQLYSFIQCFAFFSMDFQPKERLIGKTASFYTEKVYAIP